MTKTLNTDRYLTTEEAAVYLKLSPNALRVRMHRKQIPSWTHTTMNGSIRFLREALDEWLDYERRMKAARKACA